MTNTSAMIGLVAETQIHAGSGESNGVVDLPIYAGKSHRLALRIWLRR